MSSPDVQLRKRKTSGKAKVADASPQRSETSASAPNAALTTLVYMTAFAAAGYLIWWSKPDLIRGLVGDFIGIDVHPESEYYAPPSGAHPVDFGADPEKRDAIVAAFKHAWLAYERDAMGEDEYHPLSRQGSNLTKAGGIGYTVVDSIDTMLLMGEPLRAEYIRAREWVATEMTFERDDKFNVFETTIRVLGGLLTAHYWSGGDPLYLEKAKDLADRILPAFDTPSGLALSHINLATREATADADNYNLVSTAETATLQLEFRYLAELTGEDIYWEKAERVMRVIKAARQPSGLASIFMNQENGQFVQSAIRLGSRGDSYYEYLLKQWLQTNQTEDVYREMYDEAMTAIHEHLVQKSITGNFIYTAELIPERNQGGDISWRLVPKQDHLVCFFGGSLMLGAVTSGALVDPVSIPPRLEELTPQGQRDWKTGSELIRTCWKTHDTATGLSPEIAHFRIKSDGMDKMGYKIPDDWYIKGARPDEPPPYDARYILRPETVESLFLAWRLTGDPKYREWGWSIFSSIETHCRVESGGYASIMNVDQVPAQLEDKMETFLLSETFKYLYLLFADESVLPLSKYVFNTEAHPLPIFNPSFRTGFS